MLGPPAGTHIPKWENDQKPLYVKRVFESEVILLNGHFSDSDGGADGTVGKLSVMRVWWCCTSDFSRKKLMPGFGM